NYLDVNAQAPNTRKKKKIKKIRQMALDYLLVFIPLQWIAQHKTATLMYPIQSRSKNIVMTFKKQSILIFRGISSSIRSTERNDIISTKELVFNFQFENGLPIQADVFFITIPFYNRLGLNVHALFLLSTFTTDEKVDNGTKMHYDLAHYVHII
ncbi:hypothetical protein ACJX0J_012966, partial [Zea mays]